MSKWTKISIVAAVVILLVVLLYFFGGKKEEDTDEQQFVIDSWKETYHPTDRGPYGTYVMKELLDTTGLFGNFIQLQDDVMESLEDHPKVNDIYFFIGKQNYLPDSSCQHLLSFVAEGNTAFISTHVLPWDIAYEFFYNTDEVLDHNTEFDSVQYFKFLHPDLQAKRYKFKYIYNNETAERDWYFYDTTNFDVDRFEPVILGQNTKDRANYVKIKYGNGYFLFHSAPYSFTNISMLKRDGFRYAERVLEHIPPGRVQWDRYHLREHYSSGGNDEGDGEGNGPPRRSPLEFILDNPPLLWAMLVLIIGALLYALYKGKRMQRIIPAAELKQNTSMEYINTLSSLYMQQGTHGKLIRLKEKTFLNFIAERYFIFTKKADEKFIERVAVKSQIEAEKIGEIFELFDHLNGVAAVSEDDLIELHKKIEYFYKNCR